MEGNNIISKQMVRVIDVLIITPFLLYAAYKMENKAIKTGLIVVGISTALYNGINFINEKRKI